MVAAEQVQQHQGPAVALAVAGQPPPRLCDRTCPLYDDCLDKVVAAGWPSWTCAECWVYQALHGEVSYRRPQWPEMLTLAQARVLERLGRGPATLAELVEELGWTKKHVRSVCGAMSGVVCRPEGVDVYTLVHSPLEVR